jgi:preprotein translocase subunit YajC
MNVGDTVMLKRSVDFSGQSHEVTKVKDTSVEVKLKDGSTMELSKKLLVRVNVLEY